MTISHNGRIFMLTGEQLYEYHSSWHDVSNSSIMRAFSDKSSAVSLRLAMVSPVA